MHRSTILVLALIMILMVAVGEFVMIQRFLATAPMLPTTSKDILLVHGFRWVDDLADQQSCGDLPGTLSSGKAFSLGNVLVYLDGDEVIFKTKRGRYVYVPRFPGEVDALVFINELGQKFYLQFFWRDGGIYLRACKPNQPS